MNRWMMTAAACVVAWGMAHGAERVVDFGAALGTNDFVNDRGMAFEAVGLNNYCVPEWSYWEGFAASRMTNTTDAGVANQYSAAGVWSDGDGYAVSFTGWYVTPTISFAIPAAPKRVWVNNTTWAAVAMEQGDGAARAFAEGDYFVLRLHGYDVEGRPTGVVEHYLADFRDGKSVIQREWSVVDLSGLGDAVARIEVSLETTDVGEWGANTPMYVALAGLAYGYAEASGSVGVAAADDRILEWASEVVEYQPGAAVSNQFMVASNALGAAQGSMWGQGATNGIVSLGDNGWLTVGFELPIWDGPGADFAVFENAFDDSFLELAYVEVSSDGTNWARFPCHSIETSPIGEYDDASEASAYGGLAGKTVQGTGVGFDLACVRDAARAAGVDVRAIKYVRVRDVCGDGGCLDSFGNPIYDPYPTHGSPGFDLDAVGAIHVDLAMRPDEAGNPTAPQLAGFQRVLEWTDDLCGTNGWTVVEEDMLGAPGFFRYRYEREE